jgi:CBS domain-containing protein
MAESITARDLLITEGILTCAPSATLSQALAKLNSSHDAVFVVGDKEKLFGVISPYYAMYKSSYPPTTKAENCLFSPPKLKLTTPIWEIARHMIQSKVYYLPVLSENKEWIGMVSVRPLMQAVVDNKDLVNRLQFKRKTKRMITLRENATLNEARTLLRSKGVSRLPVVNGRGRLVGILTRYDLRRAFTTPKTSQRFLSRQGEKKKQLDKPIRGFFKREVVTASGKTSTAQMINLMLEKRIGSVVVLNPKWQPVNIISYRDILEAISRLEFEKGKTISTSIPDDFVDENELMILVEKLCLKLIKQDKLTRINVKVKTLKNPAQETKLYDIILTTFHPKVRSYIAKGSDYKWKEATRKAIKKLEAQALHGE